MRLRRIGFVVLSALGCARPAAPPGPWHEEAGARWRELGGSGSLTPGFTRLAPSASGITAPTPLSYSEASPYTFMDVQAEAIK